MWHGNLLVVPNILLRRLDPQQDSGAVSAGGGVAAAGLRDHEPPALQDERLSNGKLLHAIEGDSIRRAFAGMLVAATHHELAKLRCIRMHPAIAASTIRVS